MSEKEESTISPAELRVLEVLWEKSPRSASEIFDALINIEKWHSRTIKTLLARLVKKSAIRFEQEKNHYLYYPVLKKQDYQKKISRSIIKRLFGGKISPLVSYFAKQEKISKEDIQELKAILRDLEGK